MNSRSLDESIARAMDCDTPELVPFLPYILQDFHEIGSSAQSITEIIEEKAAGKGQLKILDLGCGKGAVLLSIAEKLDCKCLGIDGVTEFVRYAAGKAKEKNLENCVFRAGDIREEIKFPEKYDAIILGSIGPVLGDYYETMEKLKNLLAPGGFIILDDGYIEDESSYNHDAVVKKSTLLSQLDRAGMEIVKEYRWDEKDYHEEYGAEYNNIKKRCIELAGKYPEKRKLFEDYVKKQEMEYEVLETKIVCAAMVIAEKNNNR